MMVHYRKQQSRMWLWVWCMVGLYCLITPHLAVAQRSAMEQFLRETERHSGRRTPTALRGLVPSLFDQETLLKEVVDLRLITPPLEQPIDPETYIVGPGDHLLISILGELSQNYALTITPEGLLAIPTIGVLEVSGLSLGEVKTQVLDVTRPRYRTGLISTILLYPRQFRITVSGAVNSPGPLIATPIDRVSEVLFLANKPTDMHTRMASTDPDFVLPSTRGSDRNIEIRRLNGEIVSVDLRRYLATGRLEDNPRVQDGDVIYVPVRNVQEGAVIVAGSINIPGIYEHVAGDNLGAILELAGGLSVSADRTRVEVSRIYSVPNAAPRLESISIDLTMGPSALETPIAPRDRIFVRTAQQTRTDYLVSVKGEVRYPGTYPIQPDGIMLSRVIELAGGFTEEAFLRGGTIVRNVNQEGTSRDLNLERLSRLRLSRLSSQERADFEAQTGYRQQTIVADFVHLFNDHEASADIMLQPGDVVVIPSENETVQVMGQVANPGQIPYEPGMDLRYYVDQAGGFSKHARRGHIRIIKAETHLWISPDQTAVEVGDMIWVPRNPQRDYFAIFKETLSVAATLATLYLVIQQISK